MPKYDFTVRGAAFFPGIPFGASRSGISFGALVPGTSFRVNESDRRIRRLSVGPGFPEYLRIMSLGNRPLRDLPVARSREGSLRALPSGNLKKKNRCSTSNPSRLTHYDTASGSAAPWEIPNPLRTPQKNVGPGVTGPFDLTVPEPVHADIRSDQQHQEHQWRNLYSQRIT